MLQSFPYRKYMVYILQAMLISLSRQDSYKNKHVCIYLVFAQCTAAVILNVNLLKEC